MELTSPYRERIKFGVSSQTGRCPFFYHLSVYIVILSFIMITCVDEDASSSDLAQHCMLTTDGIHRRIIRYH